MKEDRYYIAYGSNLNILQMEHRCPSARVYGVGKLKGFRLAFKALGSYAYATIEQCVGDYVPVVVWLIQEYDELSLDRYEGFPIHYVKEYYEVEIGSKTIKGMVYIMSKDAVSCMPMMQYFNAVLVGYRAFALEESQLFEAYFRAEGYNDVSNTLQYYRHMRDLTQEQLSLLSGVSIRNIQKYESGERGIKNAKAITAIKLAESLKIPLSKLLISRE